MKALLLSFFLCLSGQILAAQILNINFEEPTEYIEIDTSIATNLWKIGIPNKDYIGSYFEGENAIITDSH